MAGYVINQHMHAKINLSNLGKSITLFTILQQLLAISTTATAAEWQPVPSPALPAADPSFARDNPPKSTDAPQWEIAPQYSPLETNKKEQSIIWQIVANPEDLIINDQDGFTSYPKSTAEIENLLKSIKPAPKDFLPLLRLGPAVPTANQLPDQELRLSFFQLAPVAGGGDAGGTGNQNYVGQIDFGFSEKVQVSAFYSNADDPLFTKPINKESNPENFWESYGSAIQYQILNADTLLIGLRASLEAWNVGSGGGSYLCSGEACSTPNIFNDSAQKVYTRNLVGSLALPLSWEASKNLQITFTPGVSFLPSTQGKDQGGAGQFYGTNITMAAGASWRIAPQFTVFGSGLLTLGPGTNSFNADLNFQRIPIVTGGVEYSINPRIGLEASLTNGFGGSPATAVLALPSEHQLMYSARMIWNPTARDNPELPFTPRTKSLTLGGLSVNSALVPPAGTVNSWVNGDSQGNIFGQLSWSASNDFQFILLDLGAFNNVYPISTLSSSFASSGGFNQRFGGKAVLLQQLRGAPITASAAVTLGRNFDIQSYQGYLYAEGIATWIANKFASFNLNPKLAWSGVSTPVGIGLSANLQLGHSFQLIPEMNLVATDWGQSNYTLGLRWLATDHAAFDLYASNAAGLYDIGQLLRVNQTRIGGKLTLQF